MVVAQPSLNGSYKTRYYMAFQAIKLRCMLAGSLNHSKHVMHGDICPKNMQQKERSNKGLFVSS